MASLTLQCRRGLNSKYCPAKQEVLIHNKFQWIRDCAVHRGSQHVLTLSSMQCTEPDFDWLTQNSGICLKGLMENTKDITKLRNESYCLPLLLRRPGFNLRASHFKMVLPKYISSSHVDENTVNLKWCENQLERVRCHECDSSKITFNAYCTVNIHKRVIPTYFGYWFSLFQAVSLHKGNVRW